MYIDKMLTTIKNILNNDENTLNELRLKQLSYIA